jgi:two-component system, sensor histidine kinase YesM
MGTIKKKHLIRITLFIIGLLLIVLVIFGISALWIINTNYLDTGYLEDETLKYNYLAEDLSNQITSADTVLQKLENNPEIAQILNLVHTSTDEVMFLYDSIDFDTLLENDSELFAFGNFVVYSTNASIAYDPHFKQLTPELQNSNWYSRINLSRRKSILFVENGEAFVLFKMSVEDNIHEFIHIGVVKLDLSYLNYVQLDDYKILLSNVSSNSILEVAGNRLLEHSLSDYFGVSNSTYLDDEMVLAYMVVVGSIATRWSLILVAEKTNFVYDFIMYSLVISSVFFAVGFVLFYRINVVKKMRASFDALSIEDIQGIITNNQPTQIDHLVQQMYEKILALVKHNQELDLINQQKEMQKNEAEIKALLSQIDPHYIFNLLNSIHKRALKNNENESAKMILLMSKQLRRSLEWKDPLVTIRDEMDHIKSFIALQQYFNGIEYSFIYDLDTRLYQERIPKLVLQTLIENALKHGKQTSDYFVKLDEKDDMIRFTVRNEVIGDIKEVQNNILNALNTTGLNQDTPGIGLQNLVLRLKFYYNDQFQVTTRINKQNISIQIMIPKLKEEAIH